MSCEKLKPGRTWFETFQRRRPPIAARQSCTTMPPEPMPPSCRTIAKSLSNAPSNARSFWMSAFEVVRAMMSRSDSVGVWESAPRVSLGPRDATDRSE